MAIEILSDNTLYANSKLGMVNTCLLAIGETPLVEGTVLEDLQQGTDGAIARDVVASTVLEVMARGWFFNTDKDFRLYPDTDGFISVPQNLLRVDAGTNDGRNRYLLRGSRIYDLQEQTYKFDAYITVDTIWSTSYEDMPFNAYNYMALRAARRFQETVIGSGDLYQYTVNAEADALINFQRENLQYKDYNLLSQRVATAYVNPRWGND